MNATIAADTAATLDGFEVLDACHREILGKLAQLDALMAHLSRSGPDADARPLAREIGQFFSSIAREHHEDEERHIFPKLLATGDEELAQSVLRLQQDHGWIEEDWLEIAPQLDAVAMGMSTYDLDELKAGIEIFAALTRDHIALEESLIYPEARAAAAGRARGDGAGDGGAPPRGRPSRQGVSAAPARGGRAPT